MNRTMLRLAVVASGLLCLAWGQEEEQDPGRGVARISLMNGDVSVRRGDTGDMVAAALNAPLMAEDRLLTGTGSRAEVQLDSANMVRLAPASEVRIGALEDRRAQVQVARGMVTFRVLRDSNAQVEISTPLVSVQALRMGSYRIAVGEDGTVEICARSGEAVVNGPHGSELLAAGQTMLVRESATDPEFQMQASIPNDDWDRWNEDRDRQLQAGQSYNYVSQDVAGAEDLDRYGSWQNDPTYGYAWYPQVADDWAPYRDGQWSWLDYYGWNWVSYDPWGWAPYHYGRWFYTSGRGWGWWPGYGYGHPHWCPGLVAFVGWDGWGGIGWIPLAPFEPFYPWYGRGYYGGFRHGGYSGFVPGVVPNFNVAYGYRNARIGSAITGVDGRGFVSGRAGSAIRMNSAELGRASLVRGALPVTPGRESLRFSNQAVRANNLPQSRSDTHFFGRQQTARVDRVPFETQRQGMQQMASRALGERAGAGSTVARGSAPASTQGWSRFGESGRGASPLGYQSGGESRGGGEGWRILSPHSNGGGYSGPAPSYGGGRSYSAPAPSYSGRGYSAPSYGTAAPSRGGGSYTRSAPSGGGGHSSGGGSEGGGHHR